MPHETAAILVHSVYTIQPCTMSLYAKPTCSTVTGRSYFLAFNTAQQWSLAVASPTKVSGTEAQLCSHNICGVGTLLQPPLPKSRGQKTSSVHTIICGVGTLPHAHSPECRECAQAPSGRICRSAPLSQRTAAARWRDHGNWHDWSPAESTHTHRGEWDPCKEPALTVLPQKTLTNNLLTYSVLPLSSSRFLIETRGGSGAGP